MAIEVTPGIFLFWSFVITQEIASLTCILYYLFIYFPKLVGYCEWHLITVELNEIRRLKRKLREIREENNKKYLFGLKSNCYTVFVNEK